MGYFVILIFIQVSNQDDWKSQIKPYWIWIEFTFTCKWYKCNASFYFLGVWGGWLNEISDQTILNLNWIQIQICGSKVQTSLLSWGLRGLIEWNLRSNHIELELNSNSNRCKHGSNKFTFLGSEGVDWMKFQIKPYQTWIEFKFKFVEAWFQHFYILGAWGTNWVTPATPEADGSPSHNQTPSDTLCPPPTTGSPRASSLDILACLAPTQWHKST